MRDQRSRSWRAGALAVGAAVAFIPVLGHLAASERRAEPPRYSLGISAILEGTGEPAAGFAPGESPQYEAPDGELITVHRIRRFLERYHSPMAEHSREIVEAGVRYEVDPRVVVAISGLESSYGKRAVGHNAWGWGEARWPSWTDAIDGFTRALASNYRSLRTGRFARASRSYCPPCGDRWGVVVASIFRSI